MTPTIIPTIGPIHMIIVTVRMRAHLHQSYQVALYTTTTITIITITTIVTIIASGAIIVTITTTTIVTISKSTAATATIIATIAITMAIMIKSAFLKAIYAFSGQT